MTGAAVVAVVPRSDNCAMAVRISEMSATSASKKMAQQQTVMLAGLIICATWRTCTGFQVELKEIANPALAYAYDASAETTCSAAGCLGILTRDGDLSADSRFSCIQPALTNPDENDFGFYEDTCGVSYRLYEPSSGSRTAALASVFVAFATNSETTLRVLLDDTIVLENWTGQEGSTALQEMPGLSGYDVGELSIEAIMEEGEWMGITETEIYVEVDEVAVTGVSAAERGVVTATATVNDDSAGVTLDGDTSEQRDWSCATGDECEITYDLETVQSLEQIRIAFVGKSSTSGARINVYTAGADMVFGLVLSDVSAGARDETETGDLQTFGGIRVLARYVKIEGVVSAGGNLRITEVEVRVGGDAPVYPHRNGNTKWVPIGPLPAGGDPTSFQVSYHEKPANEGGCSAGRLEGCNIFNIKDGENTPDSRWSCGPQLGLNDLHPCAVEFDLNTNHYVRQLQLAFHKGDERHTEFSVLVKQDEGYATIIPSAISSGDTLDFQTWDVKSYASAIQIRPKFGSVKEWMSIKEMVILEKKPNSKAVAAMSFSNTANRYNNDLPASEIKKYFSFDLHNVGDTGQIRFVMVGDQTATLTAIKMKFPTDEVYVFDITWLNDDRDEVSERFTSAGGSTMWEEFALSETVDVSRVSIVAVEGPEGADADYPTLRASDCKAVGYLNTSRSTWVASTMIDSWGVIPDYIGDGTSDQEELMTAICAGAGEGFGGVTCDGVASGTPQNTPVKLIPGTYYVDGPVLLKDGVDLKGIFNLDDGELTRLESYGGGSLGYEAIITADGVTGGEVSDISVKSGVEEGAGVSGTFGSVCLEVNNSEGLDFEQLYLHDCPSAGVRFTDSDQITFDFGFGGGTADGNMVILQGVTDSYITRTSIDGLLIENSTNVVFEVGGDDEFGDPAGDIRPPEGGLQSANLVITGSSSGIVLKGIEIFSGAEPRIVLESTSPLTLDAVIFVDAEPGECLVQVPQGSDESIIVQLNVDALLELSDGNCFVLA